MIFFQDAIYSKEDLVRDYEGFLKVLSRHFSSRKHAKQVFLINGKSINNLAEIPLSTEIVMISKVLILLSSNTFKDHSLSYDLKLRYLEYHNLDDITADKWNFILYLLSIQKEAYKIKTLLTSEEFKKTIICNPLFNFNKLLNKRDMIGMSKIDSSQEKKFEVQVDRALHSIRAITQRITFGDSDLKKKVIMKEYNKSLERMDTHELINTDPDQYHRIKAIEELIKNTNSFIDNKRNHETYLNILNELLPEQPEPGIQYFKIEEDHVNYKEGWVTKYNHVEKYVQR